MRITDVHATAVRATRRYPTLIGAARLDPHAHRAHDQSDFILIRVTTDSGLVGLGEVSDLPEGMRLPDGTDATAARVAEVLRERLVGMDPFALEALQERMAFRAPPASAPAESRLLTCAADSALYDLMGKATGLPVYQLCGGLVRPDVLVSYVAFIREPELLAQEIEQQVAHGFTAFKLKVGLDPDRDLRALRLAREIAGDGASIKLDANGAWTVDEAIEILRRMERDQPAGIETPIDPGNLEGMRRVREATGLPLLEHVSTPVQAMRYAQARATDVFNVSCVGCGGILRAKKVLAVAEATGTPCLLGSTVELGVGTAAQLHLAASSPAVTWPSDLVGPLVYTSDVVAESWRWRDGRLAVPADAGLGVTLDPSAVEAVRVS